MTKTFKWSMNFAKTVKYALFFGVPGLIAWVLDFYPELSSITVGAVLTSLANWLKNREK